MRSRLAEALVIVLCAVAWPAAAAPCDPVVRLEGDAALLPEIAEGLAHRGIPVREAPGCPAVRARVERRGELLWVRISGEGSGAERSSERLVSDPATAITLIETWARADLAEPLLSTRTLVYGVPAPAPPPPPAAPPPAPVQPPPPPPPLHLHLRGEAAVGVDGSAWAGGALGLCARIGPACAGLLARAAVAVPDAVVSGQSFQRIDAEALAAVAFPFALRRVVLAPGAGVGGGLLYTGAAGTALGSTAGGLRAEVSLTASFPLGHHVGLDLGVALCAAYPAGGGATFTLPASTTTSDTHGGGNGSPGGPGSGGSGSGGPGPSGGGGPGPSGGTEQTTSTVTAPAAPWGLLRFGLGLRWGLP